MTPVVHTDIPRKEILSKKKRFSSCSFVYTFIKLITSGSRCSCEKIFFTVSFTSLNILKFFSLQMCTQKSRQKSWDPHLVWTEVLTYSYAYELHVNTILMSTQSWCTNSGMARTRITSSIKRKVVLTLTPLE